MANESIRSETESTTSNESIGSETKSTGQGTASVSPDPEDIWEIIRIITMPKKAKRNGVNVIPFLVSIGVKLLLFSSGNPTA